MKEYHGSRLLLKGALVLTLMNAACVSTTLQLSRDHPARIDAPSGRVRSEPAAILRPDAPLYPSRDPAIPTEAENRGFAQSGVSGTDSPEPDGTREAPYVGQGVIRNIGEDQLQIEHGMIPGFMMGMTMTFPVAPEAMSDALEVGDEIVFEIELLTEERFQIFSVDPVAAESDQASEDEMEHAHDTPGSTGSSVAPTPQP